MTSVTGTLLVSALLLLGILADHNPRLDTVAPASGGGRCTTGALHPTAADYCRSADRGDLPGARPSNDYALDADGIHRGWHYPCSLALA